MQPTNLTPILRPSLRATEKDPYPVDALPTCNHALSVCQQERKCIKLFENFKLHCKVRDNKCRMDDRWVWGVYVTIFIYGDVTWYFIGQLTFILLVFRIGI